MRLNWRVLLQFRLFEIHGKLLNLMAVGVSPGKTDQNFKVFCYKNNSILAFFGSVCAGSLIRCEK
jgi:hypothetical protein